ncbi:phBC6A51 family helix-turn-helix protein [Tissierella sp.]|uniref:phBC6A51 family helix-turn-helix protein n=1 Tax=Tissierella sp. TaxID=41274 RepID=UPI0028AC6E19|nr:phBC6A51 family helix-turn-helix protein [Tissierella sp.]
MIDERQRKAIELIVSGEYQITQVAELVGVHRTTIYNWMDNDEFKAEMDKRLQDIKTRAEKELNSKLLKAIDLYWELAVDPKTDKRTKQIALSYIIDRNLGKPTSKMEMADNRTDTNVSEEDILADIDALEDEGNDNVIRLAK